MIAIIDYGAGNLRSVQKAFKFLGFDAVITKDKDTIAAAEKVVLPGVGAFGDAMRSLDQNGLSGLIKRAIASGKPFLGICLGLQLLFEQSEESPGVAGLGIFEGSVVRIPERDRLKIPHMGWNSLDIQNKSRLFEGLTPKPYVYFVHSFYPEPANGDIVLATTEYGSRLVVAVEKDNVIATQFHPEKSGDVGLSMLKNFAVMKGGEA
jgi:glutamine amidotransferase